MYSTCTPSIRTTLRCQFSTIFEAPRLYVHISLLKPRARSRLRETVSGAFVVAKLEYTEVSTALPAIPSRPMHDGYKRAGANTPLSEQELGRYQISEQPSP